MYSNEMKIKLSKAIKFLIFLLKIGENGKILFKKKKKHWRTITLHERRASFV